MFTPTVPGEMIQFDEHIFQMGWELNHQQQLRCRNTSKLLSIVIMALKPGRLADQGELADCRCFPTGFVPPTVGFQFRCFVFCWLDVGRTNMKRSEKSCFFFVGFCLLVCF